MSTSEPPPMTDQGAPIDDESKQLVTDAVPSTVPVSNRRTAPVDRRRRWVVLLAALAIGVIVLFKVLGGSDGRHVTGKRVAPYVPGPADLARAAGVSPQLFLHVPAPVDPDEAEAYANRLSLGQAPLPDDRIVATYRRGDNSAETTVALLLYDNPAQAAQVDDLAKSLLPKALGLEPTDTQLPGATTARQWSGPGYAAVTFRRGGVLGFVGTTDTGDSRWLLTVAGDVLNRLIAQPPVLATATAAR